MRPLYLAVALLFVSTLSFGQNQLGWGWSSYGGVHSALANPAHLGLTRLKTQVCIVGGDAGLATNFLKIRSGNGGAQFVKTLRFGYDMVDAANGEGTQEPGELLEQNFEKNRFSVVLNGKAKNLNLFSELRGPAILFTFPKGAGMVYYRARAAFQVRDMAEPLARLIYPGIQEASQGQFNQDVPDNRFNLGANLMHEYGASVGGRIFSHDNHHLSVGGGLRYIMGLYSLDISNRGLTVNVKNRDTLFAIQSDIRYTYTDGKYLSSSDAVIPSALGRGVGLDLGVTYELLPDRFEGPGSPGITQHKLRVGASMVDAGAVFYSSKNWVRASKLGKVNTEVMLTDFDSLEIYNEKDLDSTFRRMFGLDQYNTRFTTYMPLALNISADYNVWRQFYVGFQGIYSLRAKATPGMRRFTTIVVAPRWENSIFEASIPMGLGMGGSIFQTGFFLRVSGFYMGSDNILPVFGFSGRGLNFYIGGFVPLRKKLK